MARNRFFIFPKDVQAITGLSERYGQNTIARIKKKLGKEKHQLVTVLEFCEYMHISLEEFHKYLEEA